MISRVYLAALFTCAVALDTAHNANFSRNQEACEKFGVNTYYDPERIVGPPWRIYYSWNTRMEKGCFYDMKFTKINAEIVNSFMTDMAEYLEEQPAWTAAALHMTLGRPGGDSHQALLLADRGIPGRFHGVPNLRRELNTVTKKKSVPLMQFQLKLLREGKYMAMMDCLAGMSTLCARFYEGPPDRAEVESVAKELALGDGFPACTSLF